MEKTVNSYYKETRKILASLSKSNREYFETVEDYMTLSGLLYDEIELKKLILQLALDLKDAEKDGLTAKEYFGENPKQMVDDLIRESKVATKLSLFNLFSVVIVAVCYSYFLSDFAGNGLVTLRVIDYLSSIIFGILAVIVILAFYKRSAYGLIFHKNKLSSYARVILVALLIIAIIGVTDGLKMKLAGPSMTLSPLASLGLASILVILAVYAVTRREGFKSFALVIIGYFLAGVLRMVIDGMGIQESFVQYAPIVVICLSLLLFLKATCNFICK